MFDSDGSGENCKKHSWEFSSFFLPQAALGFFMSAASSLFGSVGSTSLSCPVVSGLISEDGNESGIVHEKEVLETCELLHTFRNTSSDHEMEETQDKDNDVLPFSTASENSDQFRQFDMVDDCSDHHFLGADKGLAVSQARNTTYLLNVKGNMFKQSEKSFFGFLDPLIGEKKLAKEDSARMEHSREKSSWLALYLFLFWVEPIMSLYYIYMLITC